MRKAGSGSVRRSDEKGLFIPSKPWLVSQTCGIIFLSTFFFMYFFMYFFMIFFLIKRMRALSCIPSPGRDVETGLSEEYHSFYHYKSFCPVEDFPGRRGHTTGPPLEVNPSAGWMAQQFKALTLLAEVQGLVPSTCMTSEDCNSRSR